jgi:hypothetical protein
VYLDGVRPSDALGNVNQTQASGRKAETSGPSFKLAHDGIPASPPAEVLRSLDRVQRVSGDLRSRGLEIRFERSGEQSVTAQVVDSRGSVLREIPAATALDYLTGDLPAGDL